ncbi:hypothetical protein CRUP_034529 [Coryphaenoides rupestris]|nr:hypothetical protein CRUP_034529 [Coryphaenoides rupestris]
MAGTSTQACKEIPEPRAAIESVVTVEDDFITVIQTIDDEGEEPGHSVRFSAPPETGVHHVPGAEEEEECVELAEEAEMEAGSLEEILDVPEAQETRSTPDKEAETEGRSESYDRDETTMDDSILDSSWIDTQAVIKKTELTKKAETRSPARRSTMKPSVRQTRPIQHHSCPRRRVTADGRHPFSVAQQSLDRVDGRSCSPEKRASVPRPASILTRHGRHDHEESSTSITRSTAPRRPTYTDR